LCTPTPAANRAAATLWSRRSSTSHHSPPANRRQAPGMQGVIQRVAGQSPPASASSPFPLLSFPFPLPWSALSLL
jgi:hypothetical protein